MLAQAQLQQQLQSQQQNHSPRRHAAEPPAATVPTVFSLPNLARSRNASGMNMHGDVSPTSPLDGRFPAGRATSNLNPNAATFKMSDSGASSAIPNGLRSVSSPGPPTPTP